MRTSGHCCPQLRITLTQRAGKAVRAHYCMCTVASIVHVAQALVWRTARGYVLRRTHSPRPLLLKCTCWSAPSIGEGFPPSGVRNSPSQHARELKLAEIQRLEAQFHHNHRNRVEDEETCSQCDPLHSAHDYAVTITLGMGPILTSPGCEMRTRREGTPNRTCGRDQFFRAWNVRSCLSAAIGLMRAEAGKSHNTTQHTRIPPFICLRLYFFNITCSAYN